MKGGHYSTGEVAEILGVSQQKVIRLYDSGKLKGFNHPGPRHHRRILFSSLADFLRNEGCLSNPVYVNYMKSTWEEYGFHPPIPQQTEQSYQ